MRYVVICGGTGIDIRRLKRQILPSDHILCADGGSVHARKMGIIPDAIIGDMDSIDTETSEWAEANRIPLREYPAEKDMTDSELCLSEVPEREEILLVMPFCGRFDHVLSNVLNAAEYARGGREIRVTDGRTLIDILLGPGEVKIELESTRDMLGAEKLLISAIPVTGPASNVRSDGLYYPIGGRTLHPGQSLGVSNKPADGASEIIVALDDGVLFVIIGPDDARSGATSDEGFFPVTSGDI